MVHSRTPATTTKTPMIRVNVSTTYGSSIPRAYIHQAVPTARRTSPSPAVLKGSLSYGEVLDTAFMPAVAIIHRLSIVKNIGANCQIVKFQISSRHAAKDKPKARMATPIHLVAPETGGGFQPAAWLTPPSYTRRFRCSTPWRTSRSFENRREPSLQAVRHIPSCPLDL